MRSRQQRGTEGSACYTRRRKAHCASIVLFRFGATQMLNHQRNMAAGFIHWIGVFRVQMRATQMVRENVSCAHGIISELLGTVY